MKVPVPASSVVWVDPSDGAEWTLEQAVELTAEHVAPHWTDLLAVATIANGSWVLAIPV